MAALFQGKLNKRIAIFLCVVMLFGMVGQGLNIDLVKGGICDILGITDAYAAESDVTTWTISGTCEWGIDPDGCLWVRPEDGVSGTLAAWPETNSTYARPPWTRNASGAQIESIKSVVVKPGVQAETCYNLFAGLTNCTTIDLSGFDTGNITNMTNMFYNCSALTSLDLSGFNTSNVTKTGSMFYGCSSLTSLDISGWNTSNVTYMGNMFNNCSSLTNLDVSGWNTSNVTDMYGMFYNCSALTSLDVSGWNTGNVTDMYNMFNSCSSLTSLDVSGFDTGNVADMRYMFNGCSKLTSIDVSGFDTSNVTNMASMFKNCSSLTGLDVSRFNTSKVTNMSYMFDGCSSLTSLDVSNFNTSNVTDTSSMFEGCSKLVNLDVSGFDTSNVTGMSSMFEGCSKLVNLDVSGFDTSNVTYMTEMFSNCTALTSLDVSDFDVSNVTAIDGLFYNCSGLTTLDVSRWNTGNVTRAYYYWGHAGVFQNCSSLTALDVSGWNTSKMTEMTCMFSGCSSLTILDLSNFNTSKVTNMGSMFYRCSKLASLDVSGFDTSNVTSMNSMFSECTSLTSLDLSSFDTSKVTNMASMFSECRALTSLDINNFDTSNVTNMGQMFSGCQKLSTVKIGEDFAFNGKNISSSSSKALLPTPPSATTTGKWILEDDVDGGSAMTPAQMRDAGTVTAGTWIWQEKPTKYTVIYHYNDGTENTNTEKYVAAEDATLTTDAPTKFNEIVTGWNNAADGSGTHYDLGATIPANTYNIGDTVNLYAEWEDVQNITQIAEGVYAVTLPGDAHITIDDIPAGTTYHIAELTPDGWVLVEQHNTSGQISPLETAIASFTNRYDPASVTVTLYATKTMNAAPATEEMGFEFVLMEGATVLQTKTASNGAVFFDPITYTTEDTHIYTIKELWETYSGPLDAEEITFDRHIETVTVTTQVVDGTMTAETTYDADGPMFANRSNPGELHIIKNVIGQSLANMHDVFTFKVRLRSATGDLLDNVNIDYAPAA